MAFSRKTGSAIAGWRSNRLIIESSVLCIQELGFPKLVGQGRSVACPQTGSPQSDLICVVKTCVCHNLTNGGESIYDCPTLRLAVIYYLWVVP